MIPLRKAANISGNRGRNRGKEFEQKKVTIAIVDDKTEILEVYRRIVAQDDANRTVKFFSDPREALKQAANIDILITDWCMPGLGGDQLIQKAKKENPDMQVFLCSTENLKEQKGLVSSLEELGIISAKNIYRKHEIPEVLMSLGIMQEGAKLTGKEMMLLGW